MGVPFEYKPNREGAFCRLTRRAAIEAGSGREHPDETAPAPEAVATMLSDAQLHAMEAWLRSARSWSESSQAMVAAATDLTTSSRELAGVMDGPASGRGAMPLPAQLRLLAETIEDEGRELRDRYLTTAAEIELYGGLLD